MQRNDFIKFCLYKTLFEYFIKKWFNKILLIFYTCKCNFLGGGGILHGCMGVFPAKESGILMFAGLAPSNQTVGPLIRTPKSAANWKKNWQKVSLMTSLQLKNTRKNQGILTQGESSVQLTSFISKIIFIKRLKKFYWCKLTVLACWCKEVNSIELSLYS